MKRLFFLIGLAVLLTAGCAKDLWRSNQLNLTEEQADWFDRTSEGWIFEK